MTEHTHHTIVLGCYRCELNRDEMEAIADECMVTRTGVVHYDDCTSVTRHNSSAVRWVKAERLPDDRPCAHCMSDGLPVEVER